MKLLNYAGRQAETSCLVVCNSVPLIKIIGSAIAVAVGVNMFSNMMSEGVLAHQGRDVFVAEFVSVHSAIGHPSKLAGTDWWLAR